MKRHSAHSRRERFGTRKYPAALLSVLAVGLVAAGCGSSKTATPAAPATTALATANTTGAAATTATSASSATPSAATATPTAASNGGGRSVNGIPIPAGIGTIDDLQDMTKFCGTKPVTIGYADSWASVNSWRKIAKAELIQEAKKCPNVKNIIFTDGQGKLEKAISDIQGLVAQKVDLIVSVADFGNQELPAFRAAMDAGIPVVAVNFSNPDGEQGKDYLDVINAADEFDARVRTQWLIDHIKSDTCNILHVGGSAGNPLSSAVYKGVQAAVAANSKCKLLNNGEPLTTNWNPADEQQAVAGALVQFPKIDAVMNECGTCAPGGWQAFVQAGRPLVPWASDDTNELACQFAKLKPSNPNFESLGFNARNWLVRAAVHKALAKAEGIPNSEPDTYSLSAYWDTTKADQQPYCDPSAPPAAIWSATVGPDGYTLTKQEVIAAVS